MECMEIELLVNLIFPFNEVNYTSIILQSLAQLKSIYDKQADIISDNCDSLLFLGGKGRETLKEISELLGKETIDIYHTSDTRGNNPA